MTLDERSDSEVSESRVQSLVRLAAARLGMHLWRNNRGAGKLESGSYVRFGLATEDGSVGKGTGRHIAAFILRGEKAP